MNDYKIGDLLYAKLGTLPCVCPLFAADPNGQFLIRFSAVQQDWYSEGDLTTYRGEYKT